MEEVIFALLKIHYCTQTMLYPGEGHESAFWHKPTFYLLYDHRALLYNFHLFKIKNANFPFIPSFLSLTSVTKHLIQYLPFRKFWKLF